VPARRRLKIEMVLLTLEPAGMEVMTARLTCALANRGHDVGVTCIEGAGVLAEELRAAGHRVAVVPAPGLWSNLRAVRLEKRFRDLRPDVVHAHSGTWLKTVRAARGAAVPCVVYTEHGVLDREPWYRGALKRQAARYTDAVVSVSGPLREYLVHRVGVDPDKVCLIPNGVDTGRFRPGPRTGALRSRLGIADDRLVIGNVARLDAIKNHELLLDAFALLHARMPEAALVIVGDGALRDALEARISAHRLESHAHLFGPTRDVAAICRDFDLFVLSSKTEGTPMSLLEAMASGVCVVATAVGGIPDLLGGGRYGWLAPPDDRVALAEAMAVALRDRERRRSVAAAAREQIIARYSEAAMIETYEGLYYSHLAPDLGARECVSAAR
jgi:glycosyltransferase involved in cell wall biosynthesis